MMGVLSASWACAAGVTAETREVKGEASAELGEEDFGVVAGVGGWRDMEESPVEVVGGVGSGSDLESRVMACWWCLLCRRLMRKMARARMMRRAAEPTAMPIIIGVLRAVGGAWVGGGELVAEVPGFKMSTMLVLPRGFAG